VGSLVVNPTCCAVFTLLGLKDYGDAVQVLMVGKVGEVKLLLEEVSLRGAV